MTDDAELTPGQRLRAVREGAGKSRATLAGLMGCSVDMLKSIELGRRDLTVSMALRAAKALNVRELSQLLGPSVTYGLTEITGHKAVPDVRRALVAPRAGDGPVQSPMYLRAALDSAWQTWHTSPQQRTEAGTVLPVLLADARRAAETPGEQQREAHAILSEIYHLSQAFLAWHGDRELVWLSADRGVSEAQAADDPVAMGRALWYWAHLLRAGGHFDDAMIELDHAAALVTARAEESHEHAALLADVHMCAALTLARNGDESAWARWEQGREVTERLLPENFVHPWTRIGRVLTEVYAVMLAVDLGHGDEAHRKAANLDPASIPSTERRARHLLELARGYHQTGDQLAVVYSLGQAVDVSAETVAYNPAARDLMRQLLRRSPASTRDDVRRIGARMGMIN